MGRNKRQQNIICKTVDIQGEDVHSEEDNDSEYDSEYSSPDEDEGKEYKAMRRCFL